MTELECEFVGGYFDGRVMRVPFMGPNGPLKRVRLAIPTTITRGRDPMDFGRAVQVVEYERTGISDESHRWRYELTA